jgi:hypothetical protein
MINDRREYNLNALCIVKTIHSSQAHWVINPNPNPNILYILLEMAERVVS